MESIGGKSLRSLLLALFLLAAVASGSSSTSWSTSTTAGPLAVNFADPEGDPYGPGNYDYSSVFADAYRAEYFDLTGFSVRLEGDNVRLAVSFTNVSNPLESSLGFSPQVVHVYIVGRCENARTDTLGLNARLRAVDAWCACVIVAPNLGNYTSRIVLADGRIRAVDRIVVENNTIAAEVSLAMLVEATDANLTSWRYFVAVTAYDPDSPDGLVRISIEEREAPIVYTGEDRESLRFLPRILDMLAETSGEQYLMLSTYSAAHGDVATVAAYPYAEGTILPYVLRAITTTVTTPITVAETYVKVYTVPGVTTTVTEHVQVPKYGPELYALALVSVVLVVLLALSLDRRRFLGK